MTIQTSGPLAVNERALGPDLARGVMLLFIALANSHYFLTGTQIRGGFPMDGSALDNAVIWFIATFVDGRAFPMFGLLFGYGVAQIVRRQQGLGRQGVRQLLWRRSAALVLIGFTHGMLLYVGDILAAYGVLLFFGVWALRWSDRWLIGVAIAVFVLTALPSADSLSISTDGPDPSLLPPDPVTMLTERVVVVPFIMLVGPIGFLCPFLAGLWLGRRRVLERPDHLAGPSPWRSASSDRRGRCRDRSAFHDVLPGPVGRLDRRLHPVPARTGRRVERCRDRATGSGNVGDDRGIGRLDATHRQARPVRAADATRHLRHGVCGACLVP